MIDRLAGFQLQCLRKDAETAAANTAAAVAAAAATMTGPGGSNWGHSGCEYPVVRVRARAKGLAREYGLLACLLVCFLA